MMKVSNNKNWGIFFMNNIASRWGRVLRISTLPASLIPVLLGTVYAYTETGVWNPAVFLAMATASALIQISTNLFNDYYDYKRGLDSENSVSLGGGIIHYGMSPKQTLQLAVGMDIIAVLLGVYLCIQTSWFLALWGLLFLIIGYCYTGGPLPIAYLPLGEVVSGLSMGAGITCIAYYIQTKAFSWDSFLIAMPIILLIGLLMAANNIRDREGDAESGRKTLPILLGHTRAVTLFAAVLVIIYLWPLVLIFCYHWQPFVLLPLCSIPKAAAIIKTLWPSGLEPAVYMPAVKGTAKLNTIYGLLYIIGILLSVL